MPGWGKSGSESRGQVGGRQEQIVALSWGWLLWGKRGVIKQKISTLKIMGNNLEIWKMKRLYSIIEVIGVDVNLYFS